MRSERAAALLEALVRDDPETPEYRYRLAEGYLRFGQAREAKGDDAGAANDWKRAVAFRLAIPGLNGEFMFFHGCCHALLTGWPAGWHGNVRRRRASSEADKAMALLRKAVGMGYRTVDIFRTESALDPAPQPRRLPAPDDGPGLPGRSVRRSTREPPWPSARRLPTAPVGGPIATDGCQAYGNDHDLTQVATEAILFRPKRSGALQH